MCKRETWSIQTQMEEEDKVVAEETNLAKAKTTTKGNLMSITSTIDNMSRTLEEEHRVEGGAITPDPNDRTSPSNVNIVANSATRRQSIGKQKMRQHSQVDNSQIMPRIPTMTIVVECL